MLVIWAFAKGWTRDETALDSQKQTKLNLDEVTKMQARG